jgi:hypothetical protein
MIHPRGLSRARRAVACPLVAEPPERRELRIPLGGLSRHAVRRRRHPRWRLPLRWPLMAALAGTVAAVAGVVLATAEPQVDVTLNAGGYRVGGQLLRERSAGVYEGPGGASLVIERRLGGPVAGASAILDGRRMTGSCAPATDGETCRFVLDGTALTAADERTSSGWHRRYADGRTVAIHVTGGPDVPVPFPVGR